MVSFLRINIQVTEIKPQSHSMCLYPDPVGLGCRLGSHRGQRSAPGTGLRSSLYQLGIRPRTLSGEVRGVKPEKATRRLTVWIDPDDVTQSSSSRMTPRHDVPVATAFMRSVSDQLRLLSGSAMSIP